MSDLTTNPITANNVGITSLSVGTKKLDGIPATTGTVTNSSLPIISPSNILILPVDYSKIPPEDQFNFIEMAEFSPNRSFEYLQRMEASFYKKMPTIRRRSFSLGGTFDEKKLRANLGYVIGEEKVKEAIAEIKKFYKNFGKLKISIQKNARNDPSNIVKAMVRLVEKYNTVGIEEDKKSYGRGAVEFGKAVQLLYYLAEGDYSQSDFVKKPEFSRLEELKPQQSEFIPAYGNFVRSFYIPRDSEKRISFNTYWSGISQLLTLFDELKNLGPRPGIFHPSLRAEYNNKVAEILGKLDITLRIIKKAQAQLKDFWQKPAEGSLPENLFEPGIGYSYKKLYSQLAGALKCLADNYRVKAEVTRAQGNISQAADLAKSAQELYKKAEEYLEKNVGILDEKTLPPTNSFDNKYHDYIINAYFDWIEISLEIAKNAAGGTAQEKAAAKKLLQDIYEKRMPLLSARIGTSNYSRSPEDLLRFFKDAYLTRHLLNRLGETDSAKENLYFSAWDKFLFGNSQEGAREIRKILKEDFKIGRAAKVPKNEQLDDFIKKHPEKVYYDAERKLLIIIEPLTEEERDKVISCFSSGKEKWDVDLFVGSASETLGEMIKFDIDNSQFNYYRKIFIHSIADEKYLGISRQATERKETKTAPETAIFNNLVSTFIPQKEETIEIPKLDDSTKKAIEYGQKYFLDAQKKPKIRVETVGQGEEQKFKIFIGHELTWQEIITLFALDYHLSGQNFDFSKMNFLEQLTKQFPVWADVSKIYREKHPGLAQGAHVFMKGLENLLEEARKNRNRELLSKLSVVSEPIGLSEGYGNDPYVETSVGLSARGLYLRFEQDFESFVHQYSYGSRFRYTGEMDSDRINLFVCGAVQSEADYIKQTAKNPEGYLSDFFIDKFAKEGTPEGQQNLSVETFITEANKKAQEANGKFKEQFKLLGLPFQKEVNIQQPGEKNWIVASIYHPLDDEEYQKTRSFTDVLTYAAYRFRYFGLEPQEKADLTRRLADVKFWAGFTKLGLEMSMVPSSQTEIGDIKKAAAGPEGTEKEQAQKTIAFWAGKPALEPTDDIGKIADALNPLEKLQQAVAEFKDFENDKERKAVIDADQVKKDRLETLRCWLELKVFEAVKEFKVDEKPKEERDKLLTALALDPQKRGEIATPPAELSKVETFIIPVIKKPLVLTLKLEDPSRPLDGLYYRILRALIVTEKLPSDITKCPTDEEIETAVKNAGLEKKDEDMLIAEYKKNFGKIREWVNALKTQEESENVQNYFKNFGIE